MFPCRLWPLAAVLATAVLHAQLPPPDDPGRRLFETHCAFCHGPHGEGGKGPTLAQPTLPRASTDDALIGILRRGIQGTEMPQARLSAEEIKLVAAYVRALGRIAPETVRGDVAHGAQLYARGACAQCHTIAGHGGGYGPDLTEVGRRRSSAYLRRALTEPAAEVPQSFNPFRSDVNLPENFLFVRVTTHNGEQAAGVRVNEDTFSIQLRDVSGRIRSFAKAELSELHKDWGASPMPSFAGTFTSGELDDLVAFLSAQRGPPPPPATAASSTAVTTLH
jgi:cytochrome c oxidase cbb3-type subunit III